MAAGNQAGRVGFHALVSVNKMYRTSFYMLGSTVLALIAGRLMINAFGVAGMAIGGILGEVANSIIVILAVTRWLHIRTSQFFLAVFDFRRSASEFKSRLTLLWKSLHL
jgi:hypothetical protein